MVRLPTPGAPTSRTPGRASRDPSMASHQGPVPQHRIKRSPALVSSLPSGKFGDGDARVRKRKKTD
jgi:hypothetical protein